MRSRLAKLVAACLTVVMISAGGAALAAAAHRASRPDRRVSVLDVAGTTSLSISRSPGGTVAPKTKVTFSGTLQSSEPACVPNQKIVLVEVGVGKAGSTKTDGSGDWAITEKVRESGAYYASFDGSDSGVHPDHTVCFASQSETLQVDVG